LIKSIRNASRDGIVDVVWSDTDGALHRLASWEEPRSEYTRAMARLALELSAFVGHELTAMKSINCGTDGKGFQYYRFIMTLRGTTDARMTVSTEKIEYAHSLNARTGETVTVGVNGAPMTILERMSELEAEAELYIEGERLQPDLEFAKPELVVADSARR